MRRTRARSILQAVGSAAVVLALLQTPIEAADNEGCAFIVHTDDAVSYTYTGDYCGSDLSDPDTCTAAVTTITKDENTLALIWCFAAFPESADPEVSVVYFGLDHNLPIGYIFNYGPCGPPGTIEIPDGGWPDYPDSAGVTVGFSEPVAGDFLLPFYWVAAYGFNGRYVGTGINPRGGEASVTDAGEPPVSTDVTLFGQVRWYDLGFNECPGVPPAAPTDLTANPLGADSVFLQWQDNSNRETGFELFRKVGLAGTYASLLSVGPDTTEVIDESVAAGLTYYYRVRALGTEGNSGFSNQASATPGEIPAAPTDLVATAVSPVGIDLTWIDHADNEIGFHLHRMEGANGEWAPIEPNPGANIVSYEDRMLEPATQYSYRIRAYSEAGHSDWSEIATATTEPEPPPQDGEVVVFFGTQPVEGATVYLDSGGGFVEKGVTDADGRLAIIGIGIGDRLRAVKRLGERPAVKGGHEAVGDLMYELWLDTDLIQGDGRYEPFHVGSLQSEYILPLVHPLFRYNLVVSVDWDIPAGDSYWSALAAGFNSASSYLYNASDGQISLGSVAVYDSDVNRLGADVRIELGGTAKAWAEAVWEPVAWTTPARITLGRYYDGDAPDGMKWYRTLARLFGTYTLGLHPEYKNARGLKAGWISYRQQHPETCPANYGMMDYPYTTTEISSANDYTIDPYSSWPNMTAHYAWTGQSCWGWAETQMEQLYPGIDVKKPPHGWYPDNVTPDRLGPRDDVGVYGDYTTHDEGMPPAAPIRFERFDTGSGSFQAEVVVFVDGRPVKSAAVYKGGRGGLAYIGETGEDGAIVAAGLEHGDRLLVFHRGRRAVLTAGIDISPSFTEGRTIEVDLSRSPRPGYKWFGRDDVQAPGAAVDAKPEGSETEPSITLDIWPDEPLEALPIVVSYYGASVETLEVVEEIGENHFTSTLAFDLGDSLFDGQGLFEITVSDTVGNASTFFNSYEIALAQSGKALDLQGGFADLHVMGPDVPSSQLALITRCNSLSYSPIGFEYTPMTDHYAVHLQNDDAFSEGAGFNISYDDSTTLGFDERGLAIFRWDDAVRTWIETDNSDVAPSGDVVSAPIYAGGLYCVFATIASDDESPPGIIGDLGGIEHPRGQGHVELDWIATGDDGTQGRAMEYVVAFSDVPFGEEDWDALPKLPGLGVPEEAGTHETAILVLPEENHVYYIAIRVKDEAGNLSPMSECIRVVSGASDPNALPAPPIGLRAIDTPADSGGAVSLSWLKSADDGAGKETVVEYRIYRNIPPDVHPIIYDSVPAGTTAYIDEAALTGQVFTYWVSAADSTQESFGEGNKAFSTRNLDVPVGDFTSDEIVGINDFGLLVDTYAVDSSSVEFDPLFDLDSNGDVFAGDFSIFSDHFGEGGIPETSKAGQNAEAQVYYRHNPGEGDLVHLDIAIAQAVNLAGYSLKVTYPEATHEWTAATPDSAGAEGNILTREGGLTPLFLTAEPQAGSIWVANVIKKPLMVTAPDGAGILGRVTFSGPYTFDIHVSDIVLIDNNREMNYLVEGIPVAVDEEGLDLTPFLYRSHPNPFSEEAMIRFRIPESARVDLRLYDLQGRLIRTLVRDTREAGVHTVYWDGRSDHGHQTASGIYFYRLEISGFEMTRKLVHLR